MYNTKEDLIFALLNEIGLSIDNENNLIDQDNNFLNCETAIVIEELRWNIDRDSKPKAKVRIPILMPLERSSSPKMETKSINTEGGKSVKGASSTYTTSNYVTLDIPTHLFPEPITVFENGRTVRYRVIPKDTELVITFIGGYMKVEMIRVISISL